MRILYVFFLSALFYGCSSKLEFESFLSNESFLLASVEIDGPSPSSGNMTTAFEYKLTLVGMEGFELKEEHIILESNSISCSSIVIDNSSTSSPKVKISGCTGNGAISFDVDLGLSSITSNISSKSMVIINPTYTYLREKLSMSNNRGGCGINSLGELKCWGTNYDSDDSVQGLLGTNDSSTSYETTFQDVDSSSDYIDVSRGEIVNCAIRSDNRMLCWGKSWGIGDETYSGGDVRIPRLINDSTEYVSVHSGSYHSCGLTIDHDIKCFGDSCGSKLGRSGNNRAPLISDSGTKYQQISAGRNHTCGITVDNKLRCFGYNNNGQIGVGNTVSPQSPVTIDSTSDYNYISTMEDVTCAITTSGTLKCWGSNSDGLIGQGTSGGTFSSPTVVDSGTSFIKVDVGWRHVCAITSSNQLKCWGRNTNGQIGNGSTTGPITSPTLIDSGNTYQDISLGLLHTCAVRSDGDLYCWGNNSQGDLGDGTTTQRTSPTLIQSNFF